MNEETHWRPVSWSSLSSCTILQSALIFSASKSVIAEILLRRGPRLCEKSPLFVNPVGSSNWNFTHQWLSSSSNDYYHLARFAGSHSPEEELQLTLHTLHAEVFIYAVWCNIWVENNIEKQRGGGGFSSSATMSRFARSDVSLRGF